MTTDMVKSEQALTITTDQRSLIKNTIAKGATNEELELFFYDCKRRGVHPLDKLIHFTKRQQKGGGSVYTPIVGIDFMRSQAAASGEYAGSDDPVFEGEGPDDETFAARVTVWRLVQGQRCPFTATARWSEYHPKENDFLWQKMPHTMLAKCGESLALRKGFPQQLSGLYSREEMEQAGSDTSAPPRRTVDRGETTVDYDDSSEVVTSVVDKEKKVKGAPLFHIFTSRRRYTCLHAEAVKTAQQALRESKPVDIDYEEISYGKGTYFAINSLKIVETTTGEILDAEPDDERTHPEPDDDELTGDEFAAF